MSFRVLFVCSANICRSPTAVRLFKARLPEDLGFVVAESAGTRVEPGGDWCATARGWTGRHGVALDASSDHSARRVTPGQLRRAQLVVAMDQDVKAAVARLDLTARPRVFSVAEADRLARGVREALDGHVPLASSSITLEELPTRLQQRLTWLVEEMDAARGLVPHGKARNERESLDPHSVGVRTSHRRSLGVLDVHISSLAASFEAVAVHP